MSSPIPVKEGFDRPDKASTFLSFVRSEFHRRGTPRRLELSKKINSHPFVERQGMRVASPIGELSSFKNVDWDSLPLRFVLKYAHGWSTRGVMLLERQRDLYFDHLSLRTYTLDALTQEQERVAGTFAPAPAEWIVEEFVEPTLRVGAIPFDYKFYCFNGVVGLIVQYDRNANPPKVAVFNGEFQPLRHGRDYLRNPAKIQRAVPLVPLHAGEMLWWASHLSRQVDAPFVSVDLYDSPEGPVFGEFTYSPGATYRRMLVFADELIGRFDEYMSGHGTQPPVAGLSLAQVRALPNVDGALYDRLASYTYNSGSRGADRLCEAYSSLRSTSLPEVQRNWLSGLAENWQSVAHGVRQHLRAQGAAVPTGRPE